MPLAARVHHYGFALAMPGMLLYVVALVAWAPAWVTRRGGDGRALRAVAIGIVVDRAIVTIASLKSGSIRSASCASVCAEA